MVEFRADCSMEVRMTKLQKLMEIEGYTDLTELLSDCAADSVNPAI